jgi:hypothetical protein
MSPFNCATLLMMDLAFSTFEITTDTTRQLTPLDGTQPLVPGARAPNSAHQQQGASPCRGNGIQPRIRNQLRRREAGWRAGGGELAARRSTNVIRSDEQASRRAKAKLSAKDGAAVSTKWEPAKVGRVFMWRLTMGRWEVGVRGLGISGCISAGASRAPRRQRRHSTVETGESRWREGRQEIGMPR